MLRCTVLAVCVSQFAPANTRIYGKAALETRFDHEVFLISGSDQFGKLAPYWFSEMGRLCCCRWDTH